MSQKLRTEGITQASAIQGPGAALPSLFFKDTPVVVAPDIIEEDDPHEMDNMDCAGTVYHATEAATSLHTHCRCVLSDHRRRSATGLPTSASSAAPPCAGPGPRPPPPPPPDTHTLARVSTSSMTIIRLLRLLHSKLHPRIAP